MCPKVFIVKMRGCVVLKHKMYSWAVYITQKRKKKKGCTMCVRVMRREIRSVRSKEWKLRRVFVQK